MAGKSRYDIYKRNSWRKSGFKAAAGRAYDVPVKITSGLRRNGTVFDGLNLKSGSKATKGTGNTNHPVRAYRDIDDTVLNKEYEIITRKGTFVTKIVADEKLVVDMPYMGKEAKYKFRRMAKR